MTDKLLGFEQIKKVVKTFYRPPIIIHSNPNLLINHYFLDPINQRGKTEYVGVGYGIDGWKSTSVNSVQKIEEDGVIFHDTDGGLGQYRQHIEEKTAKKLNNLPLTFSVLVNIQVAEAFQLGFYSSEYHAAPEMDFLTVGTHLETYTTIMSDITSDLIVFISPRLTNAKAIAAKLELGTQQTLAHQDASGNWVLNDPPPNKALELLKCKRYYQKSWIGPPIDSTHKPDNRIIRNAISNHVISSIEFPVDMRTTPSVSIFSVIGEENTILNWKTDAKVTNCFTRGVSNKGFMIGANGTPFTEGEGYSFHYAASAEL